MDRGALAATSAGGVLPGASADLRNQLEQAIRYLHEAAFLARYHQPSLERSIRAFLNEVEA